MADFIGVLGEASTLTVGTHTIYTVPSGKAAKFKIMWRAKMANTGTLTITVNGIELMAPGASSGAEHWFSTTAALYDEAGTPTNAPDGTTAALTVAPAPSEYYASAGDIVSYTVGTVVLTSASFQVVGAELDVS